MSYETMEWERTMQHWSDKWYAERGHTTDRSQSCKKFDVVLDGKNFVEEKFLFCGHEYPQFLVEIIQNAENADVGWFYHVGCHYLAWFYCPQNHSDAPLAIYLSDWNKLKSRVIDLLKTAPKWQNFNVCNTGYGITINFPVQWQPLIDDGITKVYRP